MGAKALFKAQTGMDLDAIDATQIEEDAIARSIADAAKACVDAGDECTDGDNVIDKAADLASGKMPDVGSSGSGGSRLDTVTTDSTRDQKKKAAKRMREKRCGSVEVIKDRTDACLEAGKDATSIEECRDDARVGNIRKKLRAPRKEKADNREQRAKAAMDAMANCKRARSDNCEKKAQEKADKLFPKATGAADGETKETLESMKGKHKKERMRRLVQDCDAGKKAVCEKAAKDDLKKDLDVDEKEIDMIKRQSAPMIASDEIAACEDAINSKSKTKIDTIDEDCLKLGKEVFIATGSSEDAWNKKQERIKKLAKAKFAGDDTDVVVNKKQVDTFFEVDAVNGKCDDAGVERARNDIGNAAKKGDSKGKGETVVKSKAVDASTSKCRVVFATKVTEGKHKEAATFINQAKDVGKKKGKRFRDLNAGSGSSVSSSPSSEEVPYGESPESTDFSGGAVADGNNGGGDKGGDKGGNEEEAEGGLSLGSSPPSGSMPFWGASVLSAVLAVLMMSAAFER